jgi:hypothetical protein
MWSTVWSVTVMHSPLQLCAAFGSGCILAGVVLVTSSSGMDVEAMQLEELRAVSTLEQRLLSGRIAPMEHLARMASMPDLKLMRRRNFPPLDGSSPGPSPAGGLLPVRHSLERQRGNYLSRTLTATF